MVATIPRLAQVLLMVAPVAALGAPARGDVLRVLAAGATESTLRAVVAEFDRHVKRTCRGRQWRKS